MSNCNTAATDEQPKTCGTCEHAFNQDIPCCVPVIGCEDIRAVYRKSGCHHYEPRTETLEQRYQQLEEVARDMWCTMREWYEVLPTEDSPNPVPFWTHLNDRLQSLGVDVNG